MRTQPFLRRPRKIHCGRQKRSRMDKSLYFQVSSRFRIDLSVLDFQDEECNMNTHG
jgi:hypothetical protein